MKHFCKSIVGAIVIIVISVIGLRIYTYNNLLTTSVVIDHFYPLVKPKTLYTKTIEKYEYKYPDAVTKMENFAYVQTCYTDKSKNRKVEYISFGKRLKPNKFLKLVVKGQKGLNWEEIDDKSYQKK